MQLPKGWTKKRMWIIHNSYACDREGLKIELRDSHWVLFHNSRDTGNRFKTLKDALEHAEDVRAHGH